MREEDNKDAPNITENMSENYTIMKSEWQTTKLKAIQVALPIEGHPPLVPGQRWVVATTLTQV